VMKLPPVVFIQSIFSQIWRYPKYINSRKPRIPFKFSYSRQFLWRFGFSFFFVFWRMNCFQKTGNLWRNIPLNYLFFHKMAKVRDQTKITASSFFFFFVFLAFFYWRNSNFKIRK
jgi:hypothetical protein